MYNIYINNDNLAYWLELSKFNNYTLSKDPLSWSLDTERQRIAIWETQFFDEREKVDWLYQNCDLLILFLPEFITDEWCKIYDRERVIIFAGGLLNWKPAHAKMRFHRYFFWSTTDFYHQYPNLLQAVESDNKPKFFDVLLGRQKPHRDLVYNNIDHDMNIISYFRNDGDLRNNQDFVWPLEVLDRPGHEVCWTGDEVIVNGTIVSLSQVVPVDIYKQSSYSLVAETQNENSFSFFTEKIIKPMMGRRLFVVASGQYYLKNLKKLGFKTFENVIDESYDEVAELEDRIKLMLDQVSILQNLDQNWVHNSIFDILEHNYNLVMKTNWLDLMVKDLEEILKSHAK